MRRRVPAVRFLDVGDAPAPRPGGASGRGANPASPVSFGSRNALLSRKSRPAASLSGGRGGRRGVCSSSPALGRPGQGWVGGVACACTHTRIHATTSHSTGAEDECTSPPVHQDIMRSRQQHLCTYCRRSAVVAVAGGSQPDLRPDLALGEGEEGDSPRREGLGHALHSQMALQSGMR
jgi:hypothetical protein